MTTKAEARYVPQLDGLRTLAFLFVFLSHNTIPTVGRQASPALQSIDDVLRWGFTGVDFFFVLSSYLITTLLLTERESYGRIDFRLFFLRRLLRIWPLYYINLVLAFFVLPALPMPTWTPHLGTTEWEAMVGTLLPPYGVFLGNFWSPPTVPEIDQINLLWSICIEEQFYLGWCALLMVMTRTRTLLAFLACTQVFTMLFRAYQITHSTDFRFFYCNTFSHLDPMVMGSALAIVLQRGVLTTQRLRPWGPWMLVTSVALLVGIVGFAPFIGLNDISAVWVMTLVALAALLVLAGLLAYPPAASVFAHPWLSRPGKITYGMYLLHLISVDIGALVLYLYMQSRPAATLSDLVLGLLLKAGVGLALTLLLATLSWNLIERRCNDLRHRLSRLRFKGPTPF